MSEARPKGHNTFFRRAVAAGLAGALALALLNRCDDDIDDLRLSPEAIATACQEAGIEPRLSTGSALILSEPISPKSHFSGFPSEIVEESLKSSANDVVLTETAVVPAAPNQTLERTAVEYGFTPEAIKCLNGVDPTYEPSDITTIRIPRAIFDESSGQPVVVKAGDTLYGIAREYCSDGDQQQVVANIQNHTGIDPKALIPGDIVYVSCTDKGEAEFSEPNADIKSFVDTNARYAQDVEDKYSVPKEVALAIAIVESGYGKSELALNANNFHGLKANDEWNGPTYKKITTEHVTKEQMSDFEIIGEPKDIGNGYYAIQTPAYFKKFDSVAAGFEGFGDYVKNRFNGEAYSDAFVHEDPHKFLHAMVDGKGAKYATDVNYIGKVDEKITQIEALTLPSPAESIGTEIDQQESGYTRPTWKSLSDKARSQFRNSENEFNTSMERAFSANPTIEGYKEFTANIVDLTDYVKNSKYFHKSLFPRDIKFSENPPRVTMHYTAWEQDAWDYTAEEFLSAALNNGLNNGQWGAANYYLTRDGKTLSILTKPDQVAWHVGPKYSPKTRGIETPALHQSDITPEQYEGYAYFIVWQFRKDHPDVRHVTYDDMKKYAMGHGEVNELGNTKGDHTDFPTAVSNFVSFKAMQIFNVTNEQ